MRGAHSVRIEGKPFDVVSVHVLRGKVTNFKIAFESRLSTLKVIDHVESEYRDRDGQNNDFKGCPMPKTLNKVATYKGDKENQKKKKSSKKGQQQQRQEEEIATDNSYNDSTED
ncbi:unnamed protein product [Adineta ricciae]|uniref:Uncharacterized protein n=1 Tax=Adineta ricciae TaxID=249248 RepID=A0A814LAV1_ADIRI|nr:unnamed protein product [Adineta ricciae]